MVEVSTRPHSSQYFDQRAQREARYRGYDIVMQRRDLCWMVTMKPSRPELPIFQRHSFQTATQSEREALAQAKWRVDHALATEERSRRSAQGTDNRDGQNAEWELRGRQDLFRRIE